MEGLVEESFGAVLRTSNYTVVQSDNFTGYNGSDSHTDFAFLEEQNNIRFLNHLPAIVYTAIMMVVGLPGNMIVFYVYFFKWRRSTSRMFILFLAALDMLNCATTLPMEIYIMRYSIMLDKPFLCKLSRFSTYTMNSSSALILLGIAVDRFKRICRPYQKSFSEGISKNICIIAILFSLCSTWPSLLFYGTRAIDLKRVYGSACLLQNKYDNSPLPLAFLGFMGTTTMLVFAALTILYYFVGLQIYKHRNFKLKNCTHVQKFVEDKSVTVKSEGVKSSNDKSLLHVSKENNGEKIENHVVGITVTKENSEHQGNSLLQYQLALPEPSQDPGTTCGMLAVPCTAHEVSTDKSTMDFSTRDITMVSHVPSDNPDQNANDQIEVATTKPAQTIKISPKMRKPKVRRRSRKVRYLLVRGASTMNQSGRVKCVNCLTVRIGKSTLMLFLITLAYILSFLPFYIIIIVRTTDKTFVANLNTQGYMAYQLFLRSYILSSAINPVIYSFCNAQFREYVCDFMLRTFRRQTESFRANTYKER